MPATISSDTFALANKFLAKIAGGPSLFLVPVKKGFLITSSNKGNIGTFRVQSDEFLENAIEIDKDALLNATKNRKDLTFAVEGGVLNIKGKGYSAELAVSEAASVPTISKPEESAKSFTLSQDMWTWVAEAINTLRIEKAVSTIDISLYVRITDKGAFAAAYDINHMSFTFSKSTKGSVEFLLPFDVAQTLVKELPIIGTQIQLVPGAVILKTNQLSAQIALLSEADANSLDPQTVYDKCLEVPKVKGISMSMNRESLEGFFNNGSALAEAKTAVVSFDVSEKGAVAEIKSASGKIKAIVKTSCAVKIRFALQFTFVQQFLEKSKGQETVELTVIPEAFAVIKNSGAYYVAGLISEEARD